MHKVLAGLTILVVSAFVASGVYGYFANARVRSAAIQADEVEDTSAADEPTPAPAGFAECLVKKGYVVYGASWCHWCGRQKQVLFGNMFTKRAPYVDCEPKGQPANPECMGKPIQGYPTWIGPDGKPTTPNGFLTAEELSQMTGCPLK